MKTTEQLIQELSLQSTKIKSISFTDISIPFFIRTVVYSIITFMMIMKWGEVGSKLISLSFIAESILMLSACLFTLGLTYFAAIPSKLKNKHLYLLGGLFFIIITSIFFRFNLSNVVNEFHGEMHLVRGICSSVILAFTFIESFFLTRWMKNQAPTQLITSSALIIITASTMGSFLTNFFCTQHNTLHVGIWHFLPIFIMASLGSFFTAKIIKW